MLHPSSEGLGGWPTLPAAAAAAAALVELAAAAAVPLWAANQAFL